MKLSLDHIKAAIRPIIKLLIAPEIIWKPIKLITGPFPYVFLQLKELREWNECRQKEFDNRCTNILFSDLEVLNGPFASMKYPQMKSVGSALYPKLLGSYERELHGVMDYIVEQNYECIVVIGCAEGYYAVGLAMRMHNVRVHAYDIDQDAIHLCDAMADINNVQVQTSDHFSPETFLELDLGRRALIISDCEGYESELFTQATHLHFKQHDLLIETHNIGNENTRTQIRAVLSQSHSCTEYSSIHDSRRPGRFIYPELRDFDIIEKTKIMMEYRRGKSAWIFAESRS